MLWIFKIYFLWGGNHASCLPQHSYQNCNFLFIKDSYFFLYIPSIHTLVIFYFKNEEPVIFQMLLNPSSRIPLSLITGYISWQKLLEAIFFQPQKGHRCPPSFSYFIFIIGKPRGLYRNIYESFQYQYATETQNANSSSQFKIFSSTVFWVTQQ